MNKKKIILGALALASIPSIVACSPFVFIGQNSDIEAFANTNNAIFFALYNYYGIKDQHFTNKWLGMNDALAEHGIKVTGYEAQKDAKRFKIERLPESDLPKDAKIYMVNNQTWDTGLQYNKPLANYKPMAVISTCNGVEFASNPIKASGLGTQNATMGSFCANYRNAFVDGSLSYLVTKYTAHIAPIFSACVDAVDNGVAMKNEDGTALALSVTNWAVTSLEEYDKLSSVDQYELTDTVHPTILKSNMDQFFDKSNPNYGANKLSEWLANSDYETIKSLYESNEGKVDTKRTGTRIKAGLLVPGSVNDAVQAYIDYMRNYLADVYNVEMLVNESISSTNTQSIACQALIDNGAKFIISLQDDTDRNAAIKIANDNGVFFGIAGTCQNPTDYGITKDYPYFVGSVGTSIQEERRAAKQMTNYYLEKMIERGEVNNG